MVQTLNKVNYKCKEVEKYCWILTVDPRFSPRKRIVRKCPGKCLGAESESRERWGAGSGVPEEGGVRLQLFQTSIGCTAGVRLILL